MIDFDELDELERRRQSEVEAARPLRVLSLHGGQSSIKVNEYQTFDLKKRLRDALGVEPEFTFVSGPREQEKKDIDPRLLKMFGEDGDYFSWYGIQHPPLNGRSYFDALFDWSVPFQYLEVEKGVQIVREQLRRDGPYDVLVGFSQGCVAINLTTAMMIQEGESELLPKLNVLFNGLPVRDGAFRHLFLEPLPAPAAIKIFGRKDPFYDFGKAHMERYASEEILEWDGAHRFPTDDGVMQAVVDRIVRLRAPPATTARI